jgi:hypothetical protein
LLGTSKIKTLSTWVSFTITDDLQLARTWARLTPYSRGKRSVAKKSGNQACEPLFKQTNKKRQWSQMPKVLSFTVSIPS